jgi:hypothetical protein
MNEQLTLRIPLLGGGCLLVGGTWPISEQNWQFALSVLAAMKPGLVRDDPPERART